MPRKSLVIEYRPVDALVPYARNARLHSAEQVAKIAASIKRFGFNNPILVDAQATIVAGHGRVMAAASLGLDRVPVIVLGHLSDDERRAYTLADNRIALDASWDEALLAQELALVDASGLGEIAGFGRAEIDSLLLAAAGGGGGLTDPNAAPDVPVTPISVPGDLWVMGGHRVLCGSATVRADAKRVMGAESPHLMVTDPPYGVEYDAKWRQAAGLQSAGAGGIVLNDDRADWREAWALFPGSVAYVWHSGLHTAEVQASLAVHGLLLRAHIVWVKTRPVISRGAYHWQHEPALYAVKPDADDHWRFVPEHEIASYVVLKGENASWAGDRKQSTVWQIEHVKSETGHSTQKPIECMRRPIINNSDIGDAIYEPFAGSGTTVIAAEITGRRCLAIELNPAYVDVIVRRWQEFTGDDAVLDGDGRTFREIASARGVPRAA
ncbi:site-specific DNA-methyltransferase [Bradyrhizobium sp.]|uniref:site-specific DNA-methyltransferase n=1 Tax=Bradyrhizobium sp. TaxID=376 RepID=UPI0025BA1CDD|nr:site-specific DNA-methyltransferase [Bradyrhizobium sp.]